MPVRIRRHTDFSTCPPYQWKHRTPAGAEPQHTPPHKKPGPPRGIQVTRYPWSDHDDALLKELWGKPIRIIEERMKRGPSTIYKAAERLGLKGK